MRGETGDGGGGRFVTGSGETGAGAGVQGDDGVGGLSEGQVARVRKFLGKSVTPKVEAAYAQGAAVWEEFLLDEHSADTHPGAFLQRVVGVEARILHVILFVTWMMDEKGLDSARAWALVTQLRHHLAVNGFKDTGFMDEDLMSKARKAGVRSVEEAYEYMRLKEEREFMPAAPEMLDWVQKGYWEEASWDTTEGMDRRMVALAGWLMTDSGLRISNTAAPDGPLAQDHALRAEQVVALVQQRSRAAIRSIEAGNGLKEFLLGGTDQASKVIHLQIKIRTTKTVRKVKQMKTNVLDYRRETADESKFIDAILEWVKRSTCMESKSMFFRRRHLRIGTILRLTSKMVATAMKLSAEQFGLNPKRFSTCSFRKHYVSMAQATGTDAVERNQRGGWAPLSTVPDTNYYTGETVGLLGRRGGAGSRERGDGAEAKGTERGGEGGDGDGERNEEGGMDRDEGSGYANVGQA
ncbi:hypothetical protein B484DRAFT_393123 [Ochromonadaceae sp. CCMP2298]|nr:hypothetical protein B484DRAFT_393123 [Ochromonadaceae sp. CCMP2298]